MDAGPFHFSRSPTAGQALHGGRWNRDCINCHTTAGKRRIRDDGRMDTRVAEFGIACEACHGPAERHVAVNHDPARRYRLHLSPGPDPTISNPPRLSPERASQVCGQCHGVFTPVRDRRKERDWNENGFSYRPGDDLNQTRILLGHADSLRLPAVRRYLEQHPGHLEARFWSDGMVRVTGREFNGLVASPCYAGQGERKLSCLSCHVLHKSDDDPRSIEDWANRQLAPSMDGDEACLQCHGAYRVDVARHTHHRPDSGGSACTNCHMPHTAYGLMKAVRSHQISNPSVAESLEVGRPNACNLCHLDETLDWTGDHLEAWYGDPKPALGERERTIAAGVLWLLQGDAGQRALTAWSAGWEPARRASGTDWIVPFLAQLLNDPYDTVRFIARRSLRAQPGYRRFDYDFMAPPERRRAISRRVLETWVHSPNPKRSRGSAILVKPDGSLRRDLFARLVQSRDDRPIELAE